MTKKFWEHKFIIYGLMVVLLTAFTLENINDPWLVLPIGGLIIAALVIFDIFELYYKPNLKYLIFIVIPAIVTLGIYTQNLHYRLFYYLLLFYLFSHYSLRTSIPSIFILFSLNIAVYQVYLYDNTPDLVGFILNEGVMFILIALISNLLSRVILQNEVIADAREKLVIQNLELDNTLNDLKVAYTKSEESIILKERNQMAREVHDTVGHTLAAVLVELESAKIIQHEDEAGAKEKIQGAIIQVRNGLGQLRKCVNVLKDRIHVDYEAELYLLLNNLEMNIGIVFFTEINDFRTYGSSLQRNLFILIREGITNGIKHGGATTFVIKCVTEIYHIHFEMSDNGKGTTVFEKGFGLKAMTSSVRELRGTISFESAKDEGFRIAAKFPKPIINEGKVPDDDQGTNC